jgi:aryl-alcohol dehydrogenase-like predicted oxidoreductase
MIPGRATPEGTRRYADRHTSRAVPEHFRCANGLTLSSIGVGTYLGEPDDATDARYAAAVRRAWALGANVVDTAINYRFQRSERAIGRALAEAIRAGEISRDEVFISSKVGFIPFDREMPPDPGAWFQKTFVATGVARFEDVAGGAHVMTPAYLRHQVAWSRRNLGVETIDLVHLHNPETQRAERGPEAFRRAVRDAFAVLEELVRAGAIACYGTATWNGYRDDPEEDGYLDLDELLEIAREAGGGAHHFRAIQLPYNVGMPEAYLKPSQRGEPPIPRAAGAGLIVQTSASILQGRLARSLPREVRAAFADLRTDAQRAVQFVRSTPGVTTALVGTSRVEHVEEILELARIAPEPEQVEALVRR